MFFLQFSQLCKNNKCVFVTHFTFSIAKWRIVCTEKRKKKKMHCARMRKKNKNKQERFLKNLNWEKMHSNFFFLCRFFVTMDVNSTLEEEFDQFDFWNSSDNSFKQKFNCTPDERHLLENKTEWNIFCNQTVRCRPQEYYTTNYGFVGPLFQTIVFLVGVVGNILVCTVVVKTRSMRTTTNCYLVSLAVADTITLVSSVPQEVLSYHILANGNGKWVWGSVGCTLMIYLQVKI